MNTTYQGLDVLQRSRALDESSPSIKRVKGYLGTFPYKTASGP